MNIDGPQADPDLDNLFRSAADDKFNLVGEICIFTFESKPLDVDMYSPSSFMIRRRIYQRHSFQAEAHARKLDPTRDMHSVDLAADDYDSLHNYVDDLHD